MMHKANPATMLDHKHKKTVLYIYYQYDGYRGTRWKQEDMNTSTSWCRGRQRPNPLHATAPELRVAPPQQGSQDVGIDMAEKQDITR